MSSDLISKEPTNVLVSKQFTYGEFIPNEEVKESIKSDNEALTEITKGILEKEVAEEVINSIKSRIFGKTALYNYNEETNQACMIVQTMDIIAALAMHATCQDSMKELEVMSKSVQQDVSKLGGVFDAISSSIAGVFMNKEKTEEFLNYLRMIILQLFEDHPVDKIPAEMEIRYRSLNNKHTRFVDNIISAVKTSIISRLSKEQPEKDFDITKDIFPEYVSHIVIVDNLFGGVHILELGGE